MAAHGWVHCDLSWSNVRIRRHHDSESPESVVLIDFNLAARICWRLNRVSGYDRNIVVYAHQSFIGY